MTMTFDPLGAFRVLQKHAVPFVVIGGHAVNVHGFVRTTEDMDIVFLRTRDSEIRLMAALRELNARWISNDKDPKTGIEIQIPVSLDVVRARPVLWLISDVGFLDVFDHVPGVVGLTPEELIRTAQVVDTIPYASRTALLAMKKAAGRPKDLLDIAELEG